MNLNYANYETRQGVQPISWEDVHSICRGIAMAAEKFEPQVILGIARGGLYAGTLLSHLLRKDMYAVYLTRRHLDEKVSDTPVWRVRPPDLVAGLRVLVVDEISGSGQTLRMVKEELSRMGTGEVRTAVLYAHSGGVSVPDYIGLVSDALIINPWDREIIEDGSIIYHPEYRYALKQQNLLPESVLPSPGVTIYRLAKQP
jgi:uncharacterized protein